MFVAAIVSAAVAFGFQNPAPPAENSASIQGQVTDLNGQPIRKAGVTLRSANGAPPQPSYTATTGTDGKYTFETIAPGKYTLEVTRAGYLRKLYRTTPHEVFSTITVAAGQHVNSINMALTRAVTISGKVVDEDGDPVANVGLRLLHRTYDSRLTPVGGPAVSTDDSGNYRIPGLSPGSYYLSAGENPGFVFSILGGRVVNGPLTSMPAAAPGAPASWYATTFYPGVTDQSLATPIQIPAGQNDLQGVDIRLRKMPAFRITGKIVGTAACHPIEQCQVLLAPADAPLDMRLGVRGAVAHVAKDGSIDFGDNRFQPGEYFIKVTSGVPGRQLVLASQRLAIVDRDIDVVLNLQSLVELRGKVLIEGAPQTDFSKLPGTPPPSVTMQIFLYPSGSPRQSDLRSKITNDGSFTISDIAPGTYEVRVCCIAGDAWVKSIQLGSEVARDNTIEIPAGANPGQLQITLSRSAARIAGIVETDQGGPAGGGVVTLFGYPPGPGKSTITTGIDSNGRFNLARLAPGTYRLYAWDDIETAQQYDPGILKAWERYSVLITVRENASEEVRLRQIPAAAGQ